MKSLLTSIIGAYTPYVTQLSNGDEFVSLDIPYIICGVVLCIFIWCLLRLLCRFAYK